MSDTTSITSLPTNPSGGGDLGGNITISTNEHSIPNSTTAPAPGSNVGAIDDKQMSLDEATIQQIVSGLQHAGQGGATQLASRDIPQNTNDISQDPQAQNDYIAPASTNDYITEQENNIDILHQYENQENSYNNLDKLYDEIQVPILIAVLYFLFQMPVVRKTLLKFFPILFSMDGNMKLNGYLFTSVLFGMLYYMLFKVSNHFGKF
jgi:hypothetical protein|tara:strand:+ start:10268 stop:10888 length:621 start_codon:yes stop_codon:yes gene_type:complete